MEKYYFIVQDGQQQGPFTLEQLKTQPLTRETKIWYQGLDGWKLIGEIPELSELEGYLPPPVGNQQWQPLGSANTEMTDPPKSYLTEAILVTLFCCWPLGIPAIVNASKVEGKFAKGDVEGAEEASRKAKEYMQYSFWAGLVIVVLYFFFIVLTGGGSRRF